MNDGDRADLTAGWLAQVNAPITQMILDAGRLVTIRNGETAFDFEHNEHCLCGVASGMLRLSVTMNEQDPRLAHIAGPGFWLGEFEFALRTGRILEAVAAGTTKILKLDPASVDRIATSQPDIWRSILKLSVLNQATAIGAGDDLMIRDPKKRLAAVLLRLSSHRNAHQGVRPIKAIPATWSELAEAACLSRSKTAALLSEFVEAGFIRTEMRAVTVLNAKKLADVVR